MNAFVRYIEVSPISYWLSSVKKSKDAPYFLNEPLLTCAEESFAHFLLNAHLTSPIFKRGMFIIFAVNANNSPRLLKFI